ncbi:MULTISPECIES: hypothetical protein [Pseudothermotoga]|jgi:hypothetical protein|uniref:hypothetical protein n=1 Tax=Pseudothermotoga TaxID=1643951 RepID=UPI0002EF964E|nr:MULTISPECIES: hypothetical protein [Pseudothermotoga]KUK20419.1 MAG: hypothetical protein XD56_1669 [Pseudothermotoga lettingae]MDI3494815.1 hypothetical protein [Pseudothermotoga sp.]MDK2883429.1 hypothetical protein [Pseudothermotoga sp.]
MKKGSMIIAGLILLVVVSGILFSLQKLIEMRISGWVNLQNWESIVYDAPYPR